MKIETIYYIRCFKKKPDERPTAKKLIEFINQRYKTSSHVPKRQVKPLIGHKRGLTAFNIEKENLTNADDSKKWHIEKAIENFEKILETNKKDLNADNQDIAASLNNLGLAYNDQGEYKKAIDHYNKSREIMNHSLPPIHPDVAVLLNNSGLAFDEQGE